MYYYSRGDTTKTKLLNCLIALAAFSSFCSAKDTEILSAQSTLQVQAAHSTCQGTLYTELCVSTVSQIPDLHKKPLPEIISTTLNHTAGEVRTYVRKVVRILKRLRKLARLDERALDDCRDLLNDSIKDIKAAIRDLYPNKSPRKHYSDLRTLLSGAMTNFYTCLDGFAYSKSDVRDAFESNLYNISQHVSNALAMLKNIRISPPPPPSDAESTDEVFPEYGKVKGGFPTWLSGKDRRLLQAAVDTTKYDLVVAKDGSGNFTTVMEAVNAAPNNSDTRFVIHIKAGAYFEYVDIESEKKMLLFVGDGIGKTLIKGNKSVGGNFTTFASCTVCIRGDGFIAKGITFENYAGPSMHQAVAVRDSADFSAFYLCSFVGYQDTVYVHNFRQFFRECDIYGTIDFIFGNAAVVFQNCNLYARTPLPDQQNIFTAQGRLDPNQNTGISILNCKLAAGSDLIPVQSSFRNYLGRPWREYSRTVILLSYIGDLIEPAGWLEWSGDFGLKTLYYGEYMNRGPGSNTSARVKWPGYRVITNTAEALQFNVANFIQGKEWLPATSFPFYSNLTATS